LVEVERTVVAVVLVIQSVSVTVVGVHEGPAGGGGQKKRFSSAGERRGRPSLRRSALVISGGMSSFFHLLTQTEVVAYLVKVIVREGVPVV